MKTQPTTAKLEGRFSRGLDYGMLHAICVILLEWETVKGKKTRASQQAKLIETANDVYDLHGYAMGQSESDVRTRILDALATADRVFSVFRGPDPLDCSSPQFAAMLKRPGRALDLRSAYEKLRDTRNEFDRMSGGVVLAESRAVRRKPLVGLQENVWEILTAAAAYDDHGMPEVVLSGDEIALKLANLGYRNQTEKTVSGIIVKIRNKGWNVPNARGGGYYIPKPE